MNTKRCSRCKQEKDFSCFSKSKNGKYGLYNYCKECSAQWAKKYFKDNQAKLCEKKRNWSRKNKERLNTNKRKHRKENILLYKEYNRRDYLKHKEKRLETNKKWRQNNPAKVAKYRIKYDGKIVNLNNETKKYWNIILKDKCCYCFNKQSEHVDHIQPISKDGENNWDNLTGACAVCNRRKNNRPLLEFLLCK